MQDMTRLSYLHEPGVLWNIKSRYTYDDIYTYTGSILIAVNPFQALPGLYGRAQMDAYSSGGPTDLQGLPPHVYAIASAAYRRMRAEGKGQAILVRRVRDRCSVHAARDGRRVGVHVRLQAPDVACWGQAAVAQERRHSQRL